MRLLPLTLIISLAAALSSAGEDLPWSFSPVQRPVVDPAKFTDWAHDDPGAESMDGVMNFADLHAAILHLLGLDHKRLTYCSSGRVFRRTDTEGVVAEAILA